MKHPKKKRRSLAPISKLKQSTGSENPSSGQIDELSRVLNELAEGIGSVSIDKDNAAAEMIENLTETASSAPANSEDDSAEIFGSITETGSSSSGSSGLSNTDGYNRSVGGKISKRGRGNRGIAASGMVSTVLGKDYVPNRSKKSGVHKWKGCGDGGVSHEDAEQFLCSMLSDDCELGMALVKDVLGQCAYDVEKALDILLELTAPSELPKGDQNHNLDAECKDTRSFLDSNDSLTDRTSDLASSSVSDINMGFNSRNYFDVLAGFESHPPSGPKNSSELTQQVLESLFNTRKSSKHEPGSMNWKGVAKKLESLGPRFDEPSEEDTLRKQYIRATGDDYQDYRSTASQHWDSMKSYYHKAATAYANGKQEYAAYLSDQGRMCTEMARQADEKASQDIFNSRNKNIENVITIDLHGQHVKQGIKLLKLHILFGAYVRSVSLFRVITGCGSHGLGRSKIKQSVVNLLETENIEWKEENRGTLLIKLNGQREFSFLDSGSDSD